MATSSGRQWISEPTRFLTPPPVLGVAERRALALVAICQDSLYEEPTNNGSSNALVTVIVDAKESAKTGGESGVAVLGGSQIGRQALEAILCNAQLEVIGVAEDGSPLNLGRKSRTVSPALRRFVLSPRSRLHRGRVLI